MIEHGCFSSTGTKAQAAQEHEHKHKHGHREQLTWILSHTIPTQSIKCHPPSLPSW